MAGMSIDMFIDPDPRSEPPPQGGELETLSRFLRWQRQTLELKCLGLDAAGLARAARWSRPRCRCSDCSGTWPTSSGPGSRASWPARTRRPS